MSNFIVRPGVENDRNFIFSSWLKGLYFGNEWFEEIPGKIFFKNYSLIIGKILSMSDCQVFVACLPDDQDVMLGYCVCSGDTIHWVFVKESWRRFGIAKALVPKEIQRCTHLTKVGRSLKKKYMLTFDPFI